MWLVSTEESTCAAAAAGRSKRARRLLSSKNPGLFPLELAASALLSPTDLSAVGGVQAAPWDDAGWWRRAIQQPYEAGSRAGAFQGLLHYLPLTDRLLYASLSLCPALSSLLPGSIGAAGCIVLCLLRPAAATMHFIGCPWPYARTLILHTHTCLLAPGLAAVSQRG